MLRIQRRPGAAAVMLKGGIRKAFAPPDAVAAGPVVQIARDFVDPRLELIRVLHEAAQVEHALMLQYLYAAASLKPAYALLAGAPITSSSTILGVAIQEMQHLRTVNDLLVSFTARPSLGRQEFPYEFDIYPFPLQLEPLTRHSAAKYTFAEAPAGALDPTSPGADPKLNAVLDAELGTTRPNHVGSIYVYVLNLLEELNSHTVSPPMNLDNAISAIQFVKKQGEQEHFALFKSIVLADHPALAGIPGVWDLPRTDARYPSFPTALNPSAIEGNPREIADAAQRRHAWLANLHYWIVLSLLDLHFRGGGNGVYRALAVAHMTGALWPLARALASALQGIPFDPLSFGYRLGQSDGASLDLLRALFKEAQGFEKTIQAELPEDYSTDVIPTSLAALGS